MDAIPFAVAASIGAVLVAAILALWKYVMVGNKKCEDRNDRLELQVNHINELLYKRSEDREKLAWCQAAEMATALNSVSEVTARALRVLKRYDPSDSTPIPASNDDTALIVRHK
jgi:uncharacterized membrane protein (DUF106 family)